MSDTSELCLGATTPRKVLHRRACRHARKEYPFAQRFDTLEEFMDALMATGGWRWHSACMRCCADIGIRLRAIRRWHEDGLPPKRQPDGLQ